MSTNLEIEYKTKLTKNEYEELVDIYSNHNMIIQVNYYFDTAQFDLKNQGMGLRIRYYVGHGEQTLKIPQDGFLLEYTDPLSSDDSQKLISNGVIDKSGEVAKQLREYGIDPDLLILYGKLTTLRFEIEEENYKIDIDHSKYLGTADYELEIEFKEEQNSKQIFTELLFKLDIPYRKSKTKTARFFAKLYELGTTKGSS